MADNISIKDAAASTKVLKTTDDSGVHTPHHIVDVLPTVTVGTLPATPAGENQIGFTNSNIVKVSAELTRTAGGDTTAYTALDAITTATSNASGVTFTNCARINAGSGIITKVRISTNKSSITPRLRLWLYDAAPASIPNDNSAFPYLWANRATRLGNITMPGLSTEGTGSDSAGAMTVCNGVDLPFDFVCAAASRNLYGILETLDAFTPDSGQVFFIELWIQQN